MDKNKAQKSAYQQGKDDCRAGIDLLDGRYVTSKLSEWERGWKEEWELVKKEMEAKFPKETEEQKTDHREWMMGQIQIIKDGRSRGLSDDEIEKLLD